MNFELSYIPERPQKPRENGITMVMDKGLSIREMEDFLSIGGPYTDIIKLGFGTSYVLPNLQEKIDLYKKHNMDIYFGGTLFEAFILRDSFTQFIELVKRYDLPMVEVSDGSLEMDHDTKLGYIEKLAGITKVVSEVGSKDNQHIIPPYKWVSMMKNELEAGSWKVIAEARESGTTGIYMGEGKPRLGLIEEILDQVPGDRILWEAPIKSQQVYFIKKLGPNVNLGNIAPKDVIPLETLRLGLRGDTFFDFVPKKAEQPST